MTRLNDYLVALGGWEKNSIKCLKRSLRVVDVTFPFMEISFLNERRRDKYYAVFYLSCSW